LHFIACITHKKNTGPILTDGVGERHGSSIQREFTHGIPSGTDNNDHIAQSRTDVFQIFMNDVLQKGDMLPLTWT
jgi:hypothetical protein